ncbi:hypothetical protein GGI07_000374 [Coemansia sp. Benny D115]|nr:hypothetical protein GGI07_000374 [Coemansia sp. Benny D115]
MSKSQYDDELMVCWFVRGDPITVRWLWMTLNTWVVLSLLFLIANSIYVGVILSNERKDLLSFIAHSAAPITVTGESGAKSDNAGIQSVYPQSAIPGLRLSHQHSMDVVM